MNETTDEDLFRRYRHGDAAAFEQLYGRYRQPLYLFLLRSTASEPDAQDLFQELWDRVVRARDGFDGGSIKAWLFRIARNLRIDLYRRRQLRPVSGDGETERLAGKDPGPLAHSEDVDCIELMNREIGRLPADQRDAFLLKEESGLSLATIADLSGVGRETIKSRLRYAMQRLRAALEDCL
jgi:RNA polymerase sigma-70 factor (ECF subfamily)